MAVLSPIPEPAQNNHKTRIMTRENNGYVNMQQPIMEEENRTNTPDNTNELPVSAATGGALEKPG
jgi:hypothetical protein